MKLVQNLYVFHLAHKADTTLAYLNDNGVRKTREEGKNCKMFERNITSIKTISFVCVCSRVRICRL